MTTVTTPPLTRFIGEAERTLQALLARELAKAGLAFPEWVTLTLLFVEGTLERSALEQRIRAARIVAAVEEARLVEAMTAKGLIVGGAELRMTEAGLSLYQPLRRSVGALTAGLTEDMAAEDLTAARRVLEAITAKAARFLAEGSAA